MVKMVKSNICLGCKVGYSSVFTPRGNNNSGVTDHQSRVVVKRGVKNDK